MTKLRIQLQFLIQQKAKLNNLVINKILIKILVIFYEYFLRVHETCNIVHGTSFPPSAKCILELHHIGTYFSPSPKCTKLHNFIVIVSFLNNIIQYGGKTHEYRKETKFYARNNYAYVFSGDYKNYGTYL